MKEETMLAYVLPAGQHFSVFDIIPFSVFVLPETRFHGNRGVPAFVPGIPIVLLCVPAFVPGISFILLCVPAFALRFLLHQYAGLRRSPAFRSYGIRHQKRKEYSGEQKLPYFVLTYSFILYYLL